ncbi:MAG TPA: tetratricopeptide repeat protein [Ignavibacteriaceae bacterium]|nr:tetratricopeptide repeat protein [Ignavibacteriaceae bacterium]
MVRSKIILLFFVILTYTECPAQVYPDARVDSLLRAGIHQIVNQNYKSAEQVFSILNDEYSYLPFGKIYLAANKIAEAYDYAQDFDETYILNNLESAKEQSQKLVEQDEDNIWSRYFYALAEGYISYYEAIEGSWFSALSTGINSISEFEEILVEDENFYEAYIAIGTFEYWKSRKLEFIDWLPFASDTKNIGIDRLSVAIDSSSYNSHLAINSLIWIYIDQKKYEDAIKVAEKALTEFPQSRTFKWGLARAYEENNPSGAIELYSDILNSYPDSFKENYKNEITLKHLIAQQYAKLGDKKKALKYCDEILSMKNIPKKTLDELNGRLVRVKSLKKELSKRS